MKAENVSKYAPKDGGMFGYSRKQAGVIYSASKRGNIELTREQTSMLYDCADRGATTDSATQNMNYCIKCAVSAIFANDFETAQMLVNEAIAA